MKSTREVRSLKVHELRAETDAAGKRYLTGYAATFNVLSEDFGGWRERIMPGAFKRALAEKQNVFHLIQHMPHLVLGRTVAGTLELFEDEKGLRFRTLLGNRSYEQDLIETVERGEINDCSFAFGAVKQKWVEERDSNKRTIEVRELHDVDLFDVSLVAFPAYRGTSVGIDSRAMFPNGVPAEVRSRIGASETAVTDHAREMRSRVSRLQLQRSADASVAPTFKASVKQDGTLEILCYESIGKDWWDGSGVTAQKMKETMDAAGAFSKICLRINSPGGDAFEGIAIHNMLRAQGKPIECCVDGIAASAASIIAMCGDEIVMGSNAMMMIHNCWNICIGNANDMRAEADIMERIDGAIARTYVDRTRNSLEDVRAMMDAESWLSAEECQAKGFCTKVVNAAPEEEEAAAAMARSFRSLTGYSKLPERFKATPPAAAPATNPEDLARLMRAEAALRQ
jgi:ATP-dependent Clp protease protease subunit